VAGVWHVCGVIFYRSCAFPGNFVLILVLLYLMNFFGTAVRRSYTMPILSMPSYTSYFTQAVVTSMRKLFVLPRFIRELPALY
jgi:hypothetical protein